jgi:hypothetical protein
MPTLAELLASGVGERFYRKDLFPGEDKYFRQNPQTAGMMTEDQRVIINPYLPEGINTDAVKVNEAARLFMRYGLFRPGFELTDNQKQGFKGTSYEFAPKQDQRDTIAARIVSGDPSAGNISGDQKAFADALATALLSWEQK